MSKQLEKTYNPKEIESKLYEKWLEKKYFHAEVDRSKKPFTIVMPPPNITGKLHMGHALDNTLQDILIRYKRMQGYNALWVPGTDHAAISTEVKVTEQLKKEGVDKKELGREGFLARTWEWKEEYGGTITSQLKKLGTSCDWDRERFTMDEGCSKAVEEVFIKLYEKGYIYKGPRIINWCPVCKTCLSDAEVEHEEQAGHFWHIKYPIVGTDRFLEIATTRPETMLGDTAIAVHPDDERYTDIVGKMVLLPLVNKEIPIVADSYVDKEFGTGAVKITPAHDPNDFEVGKRHNLPEINVMNDDATINELGGKYAGMDRYEARKAIVADLEEQGYLVKIEDHSHNVGTHDRCHTTVEPLIKQQWFVKMEELAKPAINAIKTGELKFVPERFDKIYLHWLENIRDWCISRQIWWGHRIPAYYCDDCGEVVVAKENPCKCPKCGCEHMTQDPDTLVVSTLGWWSDQGDNIYYSKDGGTTWAGLFNDKTKEMNYQMDTSECGWLDWGRGENQAKTGWWTADININPFNSDEVMYGTGATIFSTTNMTKYETEPVTIAFDAYGLEETAIFKMVSPPAQEGAPELYSIMGDLTGFNICLQLLPCGTIEIAATPTVIGIVLDVRVASLLGIAFEVFFLIDNAVAIANLVIITGKSLVQCRNFIGILSHSLFHAHHDALLSD